MLNSIKVSLFVVFFLQIGIPQSGNSFGLTESSHQTFLGIASNYFRKDVLEFTLLEEIELVVVDKLVHSKGYIIQNQWNNVVVISLIVLVIVFIIISLVVLYIYNQKRKLTIILQEQNEEITAQNEEIKAQNEEIETQRENLLQLNEQLVKQNEIIKNNLQEIELHRNSLANLAWELQEKAELVENQRDVLIQQKKHITDSIIYAERIQRALLLPNEGIREIFPDAYVFHKPKNIISGDFYWVSEIRGYKIFAVADCTGHGVPGGIMSMLGMAYLNDIINKEYITKSSDVLEELRNRIIQSLRQHGNDNVSNETHDGMDMAICALNTNTMELQYAGAFLPLYLFRNNGAIAKEPIIIREDRMPISRFIKSDPFKNNTIKVQKGDMIYLFSDGYSDQFSQDGGKFNISRFRKLLSSIHHLDASQQLNIISSTFDEWKGKNFQVDDVLVMGIRI